MGALIYIIQEINLNCSRCKDEEEFEKYGICDTNYDGLLKQTYRINGKRVYRFKNDERKDIKCPLCYYNIPIGEEKRIFKMINTNSEGKIFSLVIASNSLIENVYKVNIFDSLESYYYEIVENMQKINIERYYQHTCKRKNFKSIIIDICSYEENYNYKNLIHRLYRYDNWKNNNKVKRELLAEREMVYNEQIRCDELNRIYEQKKRREREIEDMYETEFDNRNFEKEKDEYDQAIRFIDDGIEEYNKKLEEIQKDLDREKEDHDRSIERRIENNEIDENYQDSFDYDRKLEERKKDIDHFESICEEAIKYANYYSTKYNINKYFEEATERDGIRIDRSHQEYEEFWDYVWDRSKEYRDVRNYLKTHQYPMVNKYKLHY